MSAAPALTLSQMTARRNELAADLKTAQETLDTAREGLITGSSKAQAVTSAQADVNALMGALQSADERVAKLTAEDKARRAEQHRAALLKKLVTGAEQAQNHQQGFCNSLGDAFTAVLPLLAQAGEHLDGWVATRQTWAATYKELTQTLPADDALALLQARADLLAVRTKPYPSDFNLSFDKSPYRSAIDFLPKDLQPLWGLMFTLREMGKL